MKNLNFLVAAYLLIWSGLFLYLVFISGQQKKLGQKLSMLEELIKKKDR